MLQRRLNERIYRAYFLHISLSESKSELIQIIPQSSNSSRNENGNGISLYQAITKPSDTIRSVGVIIDHRLTFRIHAAGVAAKAKGSIGFIARTTKKQGASPEASTTLSPPLPSRACCAAQKYGGTEHHTTPASWVPPRTP